AMFARTSSRSQVLLSGTYYSTGDPAGETSLVWLIVLTSITFSPRIQSLASSSQKAPLTPFFELARLSEVAPALRRLYNSLPSSAVGSAALPAGIFVM